MKLLINNNGAHPIAIQEYNRNFFQNQNYSGVLNFEILHNNELEYHLRFLQNIYGLKEQVISLLIQQDNGVRILELLPENCYLTNITDMISNDGKRKTSITFTFNTYNIETT